MKICSEHTSLTNVFVALADSGGTSSPSINRAFSTKTGHFSTLIGLYFNFLSRSYFPVIFRLKLLLDRKIPVTNLHLIDIKSQNTSTGPGNGLLRRKWQTIHRDYNLNTGIFAYWGSKFHQKHHHFLLSSPN